MTPDQLAGNDVSALHAMVSLDPKSRFIGYENCTGEKVIFNYKLVFV